MKAERWREVDAVFQAAIEHDPAERAGFLDQVCAGDPSLRSEVEALIKSYDEAGSFIEAPVFEAAPELVASPQVGSLVGRALGPYKIIGVLGAGGMGEVYLAKDSRLGRKVALKLLPDYFIEDEQRLRRFQQEARAASALNHPNIITIFEIGKSGSLHFLATEYIQGETIRQRLSISSISVGEALDVAIQAASALDAAHKAGILHRDIKPENVMLRPDGYVKVLDFGLAKLTERDAIPDNSNAPTAVKVDTNPGTLLGTVNYMSPEQARGLDLDPRTDIFSLGVLLYEMIAGRAPFEGKSKGDVIALILAKEPPPLARYSNEVPDTLQWIVTKALAKDKEQRYQTAREMMVDLRRLSQKLEFEAEHERLIVSNLDEPRAGGATKMQAVVDTGDPLQKRTGENIGQTTSSAEIILSEIRRHKIGAALILVALTVVIAGAVLGISRLISHRQTAISSPEPFSSFKMSRLTTTGKASTAAISPDGKYIAHAMGGRAEQSLWLRHIATGSDKEIVPAAEVDYTALTFSPDGDYIYFLRWESVEGGFARVPVLGGSIKGLGRDVDGGITFSPDGRRVAFMRGYPQRNQAILAIANADGTEEQALFTRDGQRDVYPPPGRAWGPAWSPDGETIAFALRRAEAGGNYWSVMTVRVKDKVEQKITSEKWSSLGQLNWLQDGSGLIVTAADTDSAPAHQVWYVSYPSGKARKITNDTNDYSGISLTADSTALLTVQTEQTSNIWIAPGGDASSAAQITSSNSDGFYGACRAPDGRIIYTTRTRGSSNIWIVNADGTGQKQLTLDAHQNVRPAASPDGRYIVFASNRTGRYCVWRTDLDGSNPKQLSTGSYVLRPEITPDSQWVVYADLVSGKQSLWKVSIDGGNPVQLTDYTSSDAAVSPDGKQIALRFVDEQATPKRQRYTIIPIDGGTPTKVFDLPQPLAVAQLIRWSSDGSALTYIDTRKGVSNIWAYPLDGGPPKQLTTFKSGHIFTYAWSRDGKQLTVARGDITSDVVLISDSR